MYRSADDRKQSPIRRGGVKGSASCTIAPRTQLDLKGGAMCVARYYLWHTKVEKSKKDWDGVCFVWPRNPSCES